MYMEQSRNSEAGPWYDTVWNWVIFIAFMAIVGNWPGQWDNIKDHLAERDRQVVERPQRTEEAKEVLVDFQAKIRDRSITPEEAGALQVRIALIQSETDVRVCPDLIVFYEESFRVFKENYKLEVLAQWRDLIMETEFRNAFMSGQAKERGRSGMVVTGEHLWGFLLWLVKWYYLLTIPTCVVIILHTRHKQSVQETLVLHGGHLIKYSLGGPLTLLIAAENLDIARRYLRAEAEFRRGKGWGHHLTAEEQDAIWLQARQPLVRFEEALERVREGGERARRPIIACVLVWLLSLPYQGGSMSLRSLVVITSYMNATNQIVVGNPTDDHHDHSAIILAAPVELPEIRSVETRDNPREPFAWPPVAV